MSPAMAALGSSVGALAHDGNALNKFGYGVPKRAAALPWLKRGCGKLLPVSQMATNLVLRTVSVGR